MWILVTGAWGFIGKQLCEALVQQGHQVVKFRGDVRSFENCKKNLRNIQAVYHLAAVLDEENKKELFEVNVKGTQNMIEAAAKENIEQFIFVSSVTVMGDFQGIGVEETPIKAVTLYGQSKADAEKLVWESQEMLPITIIRPALVIGANKYWKRIIELVQKGFPIIGDGKNLFQMVHTKDVIEALTLVLGKQECIGEIFIVAEEKPKTVEEIYLLIQKELGIKEKARKMPKWLGFLISYLSVLKARLFGGETFLAPSHVKRMTKNRHYSTEKIEKLGWKPKYSTEQAIKETVKEVLAEKFVE